MKKIFMLFIAISISIMLYGCNNQNISNTTVGADGNMSKLDISNTTVGGDINMSKLVLKIDDQEVDVSWEDNESVNDLKALAKNGLRVNMSMYGGFEVVGSIGKAIKSNDSRITTTPGDIMLYSSSSIVMLYGSNTWEYTKLGHINLSKDEIINLIGNKNVIVTLELK